VHKTKSVGQVLREAGHINKSLSTLEQVIVALSERQRDHIPYRSSKLTHLLRDSIGGNCKTCMIANVWGDDSQLDETLSTCRFAQRMARIQNEVSVNVVKDDAKLVVHLEREVRELREELAMHDQMVQGDSKCYAPYSADQQRLLKEQLSSFFAAPASERDLRPLELPSVRHMREVLYAARALYQELEGRCSAADARVSGSLGTAWLASDSAPALHTHSSAASAEADERPNGGPSTSYGAAPSDVRPATDNASADSASTSTTESAGVRGWRLGVGDKC